MGEAGGETPMASSCDYFKKPKRYDFLLLPIE